jgi:hypothetical protein
MGQDLLNRVKKIRKIAKRRMKKNMQITPLPMITPTPTHTPIINLAIPTPQKIILDKPILNEEPNQYNTVKSDIQGIQGIKHQIVHEKGSIDKYINETISPYINDILTHVPTTESVKNYMHQTILDYAPPHVKMVTGAANKIYQTGKYIKNMKFDLNLNEQQINDNKLLLKRMGKAALFGGLMAGSSLIMPGVGSIILSSMLSAFL